MTRLTRKDEDWDTEEVARWIDNDEAIYTAVMHAAEDETLDEVTIVDIVWECIPTRWNIDKAAVDWTELALRYMP